VKRRLAWVQSAIHPPYDLEGGLPYRNTRRVNLLPRRSFWSITMSSRMQTAARSRTAPIACQSCRAKKLKCERRQPCSNCSSRGITCHFVVPPPPQPDEDPATQSNAELLQRVTTLEAIIQRQEVHTRQDQDDSRPRKRQTLTPSSGMASDIHQTRDEDLQSLENVATREDSVVGHPSLGALESVCSLT
jgi:hypothetical protein